ncbi:MAG: SAM-dependent methyltransferase [Planctomycetota bacterium]
MAEPEHDYVSRGGLKLAAALDAYEIDPSGAVCADLGCSTGGFVDVWLRRGAARVYAVDTAYGELAWRLRQDPAVSVMERTNALHAPGSGNCAFVSVDLGWTKMERAVPAALRWLTDDAAGRLVTLIKPHYESGRHRLGDDEADAVTAGVVESVSGSLGVEALGWMRSPIRGGKGKNLEHLAVWRRRPGVAS